MKLSDFDYALPESLIAQLPVDQRDSSRLLVLDKQTNRISHKSFTGIIEYLKPGDLLVINNSKVFPARLYGQKEITGGKVELLLQKQIKDNVWETIGKGLRGGVRIKFAGSSLEASVLQKNNDVYEIFFNLNGKKFYQELDKIGAVPLPPYIRRTEEQKEPTTASAHDRERYQTVYAKERGSVAAPTAGLHFTPELIEAIKKHGVDIAEVTLHVGLGTFAPVKTDEIEQHKMHHEYYSVVPEEMGKIVNAKKEGRRVIAVGTTTTRVLETIYASLSTNQLISPFANQPISGQTNIFIYPPYKFKCVDGIVTNFHLPKSTLLMLISAFTSREAILAAYKEAVKNEYRFFSYGDAMLII